jgi:hypothetical protein
MAQPFSIIARLTVRAALLGTAFGCATTGTGEEPPPPLPSRPTDPTVQRYLAAGGNRFADLLAAREESRTLQFSLDVNWISGLLSAELGRYSSAGTEFTPLTRGGFEALPLMNQCANAALPDAVETFCAQIGEVSAEALLADPTALPPQFVFIEDRPNLPAMRVFGQRILQCAKDAGFTHFAVEALQEEATAVGARGYVTLDSGLYTREPQFARLISESLELGYELVNFVPETWVASTNYEQDVDAYAQAEATDLLGKTVGTDPNAKVLVWTAPRQSRKQEWRTNNTAAWHKSLATLIFEQTSREPYALDQLTMQPTVALGSPPASGAFLAGGPTNGRCAGAFFPQSRTGLGALDGIVMHRAATSDVERWAWLSALDAERTTITANCSTCAATSDLLVQAFPAAVDTTNRVPTDQAICRVSSACQFVLPAGNYQFEAWSDSAKLGTQTVELEAAGSVTLSF